MAKIKSSLVFKAHCPSQGFLLPPSLGDLIPSNHMVRLVARVVDEMDISDLYNLYKGGGASAFHPRMLLKVLLYAYSVKIYTGRRIARALHQDIHFMWLSGMSYPDFRTINYFRSKRAKEVIETLFKGMLEILMEEGYIKMENYFCDGSTFVADANKYKMVWKKNSERYLALAEQKCKELFKKIDKLNDLEEKEYGDKDLEENGSDSEVTSESVHAHVKKLNERVKTAVTKKARQQAGSLKSELSKAAGKVNKYKNQLSKAGKRSGYNATDNDASAMMMKNKVEILPAYNVIAGCEDQFITGVSVHQNPNDGTCLADHLEQCAVQQPMTPVRIIADAGFGTEQNYELLEQLEVENYMKFNTFHAEEKKSYSSKIFLKQNFPYDTETDTYTCPNKQSLVFLKSYNSTHQRTGYKSFVKEYGCSSCDGCPFYQQCCKSDAGANRTIHINEKLENYKQQARENLRSESGLKLRKQRSIEIESCFGDIKHNSGFRRFHLRGLKKVKTETILVAMAHNFKKMYLKGLEKAS